jgi:hypothetical protein
MANYIVTYTINSDSSKDTAFSDFLAKIGLKDAVDQSTRYGSFEDNYRALQSRIKTECINLKLTEADVVYLFSAGRNSNLTIKKSIINGKSL